LGKIGRGENLKVYVLVRGRATSVKVFKRRERAEEELNKELEKTGDVGLWDCIIEDAVKKKIKRRKPKPATHRASIETVTPLKTSAEDHGIWTLLHRIWRGEGSDWMIETETVTCPRCEIQYDVKDAWDRIRRYGRWWEILPCPFCGHHIKRY